MQVVEETAVAVSTQPNDVNLSVPFATQETVQPVSDPVAPLEVEEHELSALLSGLKENSETADLDTFWSDALQQANIDQSRGLTLEEAQQRGLISSDLTEEGEET